MKTASIVASGLALASSAFASPTTSVQKRDTVTPITIKGNAFFQGDSRFYIRGVDYQPGGSSSPVDPIANPTTCKRDIEYFKQLGLNTIRVYTVDNTANHDECMSALADAGIYLALDVNNGLYSIRRDKPAQSYNAPYLQSVFATIDAFANYPNTLLFFSGNEVINTATNTAAAPYVKAVTRDMRQYIRSRNYRTIPVGYSAADVSQNRYQMAEYMNCGGDDARSDFFSFNDYSWCDPSSFTTSGWSQEVAFYSNYSIPLFLSEYGCNKNPPREFQEVSALYSTEMSAVYSGGLVYEYSEEADNPNFGLVTINGESIKTNTDFSNLMSQFKNTPNPSGDGGYSTNNPISNCPSPSANWNVQNDYLPVMPEQAMIYMKDGAGKGPGLDGPGSQEVGAQSTASATPGNDLATETGSASSSSSSGVAASTLSKPGDFTPIYVCGLVVVLSTFFGASLL